MNFENSYKPLCNLYITDYLVELSSLEVNSIFKIPLDFFKFHIFFFSYYLIFFNLWL